MICNLKALGLALVAVFAMSAMAASGASAQGVLTASEPVTLVGDEDGLNALTGSAGVVKCPGSTVTGHGTLTKEQTAEGKKHTLITSGASSVTLTPHYVNCLTTTPDEAEHRTTVTMNGCDYDLNVLETVKDEEGEPVANEYDVSASLVCPTGKNVVLDVYPFKGSELGGVACSIVVPAQSGLTGPVLSNEGEDLTLAGTFKEVKSSQSGFGCATGESTTDELHVNYTVTGQNNVPEPVAISVSD